MVTFRWLGHLERIYVTVQHSDIGGDDMFPLDENENQNIFLALEAIHYFCGDNHGSILGLLLFSL